MSDDDFLQAMNEHLDLLYNLARRLTRCRSQAEDLVQETYLHALRGGGGRRTTCGPGSRRSA